MSPVESLVVVLACYLAGSVPFGLVVMRLAGRGDIRRVGSGNIGATNVLRSGSRLLAALTLCLDAGKGAAAVIATMAATGQIGLAVAGGLAAVVGHCFTPWLALRGGKGVATCVGVFTALDPRLGFVFAAAWLLVAMLTRFSSLAALLATLSVCIAAYLMQLADIVVFGVFAMTAIVWSRHHANIARLAAGTESRIGRKPK